MRPALGSEIVSRSWFGIKTASNMTYLATSFAASSFMRCSTYSMASRCEMMASLEQGRKMES